MNGRVCPGCGEQIQEEEIRCPHCRARLGRLGSWFQSLSPKLLLIVGLVLLLPGGFTVVYGSIGLGDPRERWFALGIVAGGIVPALAGILLLRAAHKRYRR